MTIEEAVATQLLPYAHTTLLTEPEKKEYVFTFGYNSKYKDCFKIIRATSHDEAVKEAVETLGSYAMMFSHPNARTKSGIEFFNLKEI